MDIADINKRAIAFAAHLKATKERIGQCACNWYPYGSLGNFAHLDVLLTGERRSIMNLIGGKPIADIGGADGDVSFFLETLGCTVDFIDNPPTNNNRMQGVRLLKSTLNSSIHIHEVDLDSQFRLPRQYYNLVFFLGILYHLKNPIYVLEALAKSTKYCFISTKIAQVSPDKQTRFSHLPMAYLLDNLEANNDPTNFWIFSEAGLRRLLKRTGWIVLDYMSVGNTANSDPASGRAGDERAYCLVKSRHSPVESINSVDGIEI